MKGSRPICKTAEWISICLLVCSLASGQSSTSQLRGNVADPSGAAVPNASVHLIRSSDNSERTTTADHRGSYTFSDVSPGVYRLMIEASGFETYQQSNIHLVAGVPTILNVTLEIRQVQQSVTVRAHDSDQCVAPQARVLLGVGPGLRAIRRGPSGNYYVLTAPGAVAAIYSPNGKRIGQVPAASSIRSAPNSAIINGSDLQVDSAGRVYIADLAANAVKIYSAAGNLIGKIRVAAPISVEPLPDGEVAVASLYSKHLVDVYDQVQGEVYRSFGDTNNPVEHCDSDILRCTEDDQNTASITTRWFYGDSAGDIYVNVANAAPTIRKYDADGIRAYQFTLPLNQPISAPGSWSVNAVVPLAGVVTGPGNTTSAATATSSGGGAAGTGQTRSEDSEGSARGERMQSQAMRLGLRITQRAGPAEANPIVDAIGADPSSSEVWAIVGGNLLHLDRDGNLAGYYCLSTSGQASVTADTILVEPNRILIGSDPFGILEYPRPDKPSSAAAPSH